MCTEHHSSGRHHEEYLLPCAEALLAGTLALMTGVAQAPPGCAKAAPMAAKIVANLCELTEHPGLSDAMRVLLARLGTHWLGLARERSAVSSGGLDRTPWPNGPARLQ